MITLDLSILNQKGTPMFFSDLTANRPAAGIVGRIFIATNSPYGIFRDTGTGWDQVSSAGGGATIYTGDGSLTGNRTINTNPLGISYTLKFTDGSNQQGIVFHRQTLSGLPYYYAISGRDVPIGTNGNATNYNIAPSFNGNQLWLNAGQGVTLSLSGIPGIALTGTNNVIFQNGGTFVDAGFRVDIQGTARITGDTTFIKSGGNFGIVTRTTLSGNPAIQYLYNGGLSTGQTISFGFGATTISGQDNPGAAGGAILSVAGSAAFTGNLFTITKGADTNPDPNWAFGVTASADLICKNGATIRAQSFAYAVGGSLNIQGGSPRGDVPNASGGNLFVNGGVGTGTGTSGDVIIGTASATTSGTNIQTLTNRWWVKGSSGVLTNTATPYAPSTFKVDINGGVLIKNSTGTTAQITLINADPSLGGNEAFIVHSVGGTSGSSYAELQGYYGTSIVGSTAIRLNPAGGAVIVNSTTNSGEQFQVTGTLRVNGQRSASAGGNSGQHLIINCDGVSYKIALLNP